METRKVEFVATRNDENGHKHWSIASFDNVTRTITYFSDYMFKKNNDKTASTKC